MARTIADDFADFRSNPIAFLTKRGFNIPENIPNDPVQIQNYILSSGMISQEQVGQVYNQKKQMEQILAMFNPNNKYA